MPDMAAAASKTKITDLDKLLNGLTTREPEFETVQMKLFGREWEFITNIPAYRQFGMDEDAFSAARLLDFIEGLVIEDQKIAWKRAWASTDLDPEELVEVVGKILEELSGKLSEPSSGSPAGRSTGASKRTSVAR